MTPTYWAVLLAIGIAILGVIFGVAGIFLAPLLGVAAIVALVFWLVERRTTRKPPLE
jgi:predicted PurR-regulated permease PerM